MKWKQIGYILELYWGYLGIMENELETNRVYIGVVLGLCWDNGR